MNKRLFCIDIDGTLVRSDYTLGPLTKSLFPRLAEDGDIVLLSSGRPIRSLYPYYQKLKLKGPLCCYNGSYVGHPYNGLCFPTIDPYIEKEELLKLLSPFADKLDFFMGENHHVNVESRPNPFLEKYFPIEGIKHHIVSSLEELPDKMKIAIISTSKEVANQIKQRFEGHPHYSFHFWRNEPYCEIVLREANKGDALDKVAAYYGVEKEDIFAFGDSENDYPMLKRAAHAYAMKGCKSARLAENFKATEKGNDQDGVAFEILKYCD